MDTRLVADLIADVPEPMVVVDPEGSVVAMNDAARRRLPAAAGISAGAAVPLLDWAPAGAREDIRAAIEDARATGHAQIAPNPIMTSSVGHDAVPLVIRRIGDAGAVMLTTTSEPISRGFGDDFDDRRDPVTGLLNRRALPVIVDRELTRAARSGAPPMALLFVMLRDFKQINQMHGHHIGDLLLENTGIRIRDTVRKSDFVFRWEGTNLVVLLPELATRLDGLVVAEKIHSAVTVPYRFRDLDLAPGCHVGIALYPDDADSADELFNRANSAVIEAERHGDPFRYFDQETHQRASERLTLRTGLQRAFARNELELYFQPIVTVDGAIAGAEALIRWNHPERGLLGPGAFIELAEDSRLIAPIDKLAIYTACRQLTELTDRPEFFISLNVSAINLSDSSLPTVVTQAISDAGLRDPSRLKLELTESRTAEDTPKFLTVMNTILELGVEVWIDDFGTGQSSLSYLKHLPVTTVKIDKDFVAELDTDSGDVDYLSGIIQTVRSRRKQIVIEGVGSRDQFELVRRLPVDFLQGFYFARPMPAGDLLALLRGGGTLPTPPSP